MGEEQARRNLTQVRRVLRQALPCRPAHSPWPLGHLEISVLALFTTSALGLLGS